MDSKIIADGNVLFYSLETSFLIKQIRNDLNINCTYLKYDENLKYFYNTYNRQIYEYVFTKPLKNELMESITNKLKQYKNNINDESKYIIFHNFHFVQDTFYKQFKYLFNRLCENTSFIFTSNKQISFLQSYFLTLFVRYPKTQIHNDFIINIENDCNDLINMIYKPYESIDFNSIRNKLYSLLFSYQDSTLILKYLSKCSIKKKPKQQHSITRFTSMTEYMKLKGNKDIIYLEHFIILLINNDNI